MKKLFIKKYAFHVDSAKQGAKLTFNNCAFNGFTTFASTVEEVVVNDGEINDGFIIRQDVTMDGVDFSEDATLQLGTGNDNITDVEVKVTDCTVKDENGEVSDKTVADLFSDNNTEDEKDNLIVIDNKVIVGTVPEANVPTYSAPQTGDNSQLLLWAGMMIVAVIGMVAFGKKRAATDR